MAEVECCGECRFYVHRHTSMYDGRCRRYPPTLTESGDEDRNDHGIYPPTDFNWWCGEFRRRETEKKT